MSRPVSSPSEEDPTIGHSLTKNPMAVPITHLMVDQPPLVTIEPSETLQVALARMIEHDFTQLPVVENGRPYGNPASLITMGSIARAARFFGTTLDALRVRDAAFSARTLSIDEDLFSKMDDLLASYAVLVLRPDGSLAGIVTNYDATQYFRSRAEDVLLVEDIETTLKDHVRIAYGAEENAADGGLQEAIRALGGPLDTVREDCRKAFRRFCGQRGVQLSDADVAECVDRHFERSKSERGFDDLNLSDYIQLARRTDAWKVLGPLFGISDRAFLEMLEGVRRTRNKLMHFRPDIDAVDRDQLRFCAEWFKNHPPITTSVPPPVDLGSGGAEADAPERDGQEEPTDYIGEATEDDAILPEAAAVDGKYAPLAHFLTQQPLSSDRVALSFGEIERILGASLPASAHQHRSWWANNAATHVQAQQWLRVNWRVVSVNMTKEQVIFSRARDRDQAYIRFFSDVQKRLQEDPSFPAQTASPLGLNWLTLHTYPNTGLSLVLSFARGHRLRLECYIDTGHRAENERVLAAMREAGHRFESLLGAAPEWEQLEGKRACRIAIYERGAVTDPPEVLAELSAWAATYAPRLHAAVHSLVPEVAPQPAPRTPASPITPHD
jgi:CBS domain-containing protein